MTTPTKAPPSREAEIAARLEKRLKAPVGDAFAEAHSEWLAHAADDIRYLLAQLQQARQERDAARQALEKVAHRFMPHVTYQDRGHWLNTQDMADYTDAALKDEGR